MSHILTVNILFLLFVCFLLSFFFVFFSQISKRVRNELNDLIQRKTQIFKQNQNQTINTTNITTKSR